MKLKQIENKLTEAGLSDVYGIVLQQALAHVALTDKVFHEHLAIKVLYSLKTDITYTEISCDFVLKAVKAHEEYLVYFKRNESIIVDAVLKILGLTIEQVKEIK